MIKYTLLAASLTLAACHTSDTTPSLDFGAGDGITHLDTQALPNGLQDPTDWASDATWSEQEIGLFPELSLSLNSQPPAGVLAYTYVYPNPGRSANWLLKLNNSTTSYTLAAVLVDKHYQVMKRFDHGAFTGAHGYGFDYSLLGLNSGDTYRLYYVLFNSSGLLCKGHGDIHYN